MNDLELFMSQAGEPTVTIKQHDLTLNVPTSSQEFKDHLLYYVVSRCKVVPDRKVIADAVYLAESLSRVSMKKIELHHRMFFDGKQLVLDLVRDDGLFVVANTGGWTISKNVSCKFIRYPHSSPLPLPDTNGSVLELLPFLNIHDEYDQILVICWLIASLVTTIPRAILCFHGSPGSAKTSQATMLKNLVDPSYEGGLYIRNKEDEMALLLAQSAMPFFDNLTTVTKAIENMLCMAATGGGYKKRKLYTDSNSVQYRFKKPIIMTGINIPYDAQDLMDRTISIELSRISEEKRRYETEVMESFEAAKPRILGGMLNVFCGAMRRLPTMQLIHRPRMADFALWISAIAEEIGEANGFSAVKAQTAMLRALDRGYKSSIAGDKLILALIDFLDVHEKDGHREITGSVSQCHVAFTQHVMVINRSADFIPSTPQLFSQVLKKYIPVLEVNGWILKFSENRKHGRFLTFTKAPQIHNPS